MHNIAIEFERAEIKFAQLPRKRQQTKKNGKNSLWQSHSLQLMVGRLVSRMRNHDEVVAKIYQWRIVKKRTHYFAAFSVHKKLLKYCLVKKRVYLHSFAKSLKLASKWQ